MIQEARSSRTGVLEGNPKETGSGSEADTALIAPARLPEGWGLGSQAGRGTPFRLATTYVFSQLTREAGDDFLPVADEKLTGASYMEGASCPPPGGPHRGGHWP